MRFVDSIDKQNERERFVRGVKDLVSSFILLTLLQFLYTLAITDEDKKRLLQRRMRASANAGNNDLY